MRIEVSFKYLERSEFIDNVLEKNIKKIERRIKMFKKDSPIHISAHVEKNPHREQYFCRTQVYLPSKVLRAQEKGANFSIAINKSFAALIKQLDRFKYKLEAHLKKRREKASRVISE
ncbi:MAG: HPF/RaiA family ribosome-associated protein [Candidatus Omnitrophota bacterium]|nr:MAG: HPF/RaiA family ribosome-associated protein [Candidatus Omnitrophota bacterium]